MDQQPTTARIVVVEQIYFQSTDNMPVQTEHRFVRQLKSDEQPYVRRMKIGTEWQPLECGWIDECSMLLIEHEAPNWQVMPTAEERKAVNDRIVEIALYNSTMFDPSAIVPDWYIPVGESFRGSPVALENIYLRCTEGETRIKVTLFPS